MATSARIQEKIAELLSDGENHSVQEIKSYLTEVGVSDYSEGQFSGSINTMIRNGSIEKIDRGVYAIGKENEKMTKRCFIVSPIGEEGSVTRSNADKLLNHILKPVCENCGFEAFRSDMNLGSDVITETIIDNLENADLVIADISEHNPNVFYEMGFRARTRKPIIYLKPKSEKLPFDVASIRTIEYDLTDLDNVLQVKERLEKTINAFEYSDSDEEAEEKNDTFVPSIMPILYDIQDSIAKLENKIENNNNDTLEKVINCMRPQQPVMSAEEALQAQLMASLMQNPDNFMKLYQMSEQINKKQKRR